jgi:SAM-dependent methyltransferase
LIDQRLRVTPFNFIKRRLVGPIVAWLDRHIDLYYIANGSLRREIALRAPACRGLLLDVGCGYQPYRELFTTIDGYVAMDRTTAAAPDLCGDALALPFGDALFDTVICNQVLEHVPDPARVMSEVARVLKPCGQLLLTTPQTWGLHLEPYDFYRYTKYGLAHLGRQAGFDVIDVVPTTGLAATIAQRIVDTISVAYVAPARIAYRGPAKALLLPILWIGNGLDHVLRRRGDTLDNLMFARKKPDGT